MLTIYIGLIGCALLNLKPQENPSSNQIFTHRPFVNASTQTLQPMDKELHSISDLIYIDPVDVYLEVAFHTGGGGKIIEKSFKLKATAQLFDLYSED